MQLFLATLLTLLGLVGSTDPEVGMDAVHIIEYWGFEAEEYKVTTEDGYILQIQRIPHGKSGPTSGPKPIIFMQHGLEASSTNWIANLPHQSAERSEWDQCDCVGAITGFQRERECTPSFEGIFLERPPVHLKLNVKSTVTIQKAHRFIVAFMFADAGFDVWLGNFRGNMYGKAHKTLSVSSKQFWEFSWDEMAEYDLPATIDFVLKKTGASELYYMGHSEGTMTVFALCSHDQEFCKKIKHFYALAPVAQLKHIKGLLSFIAPYTKEIDYLLNLVGVNEFLPNNWFTDLIASVVCGGSWTSSVCDNLMFLIAGPDSTQTNKTRTPVYLSHVPAGTSTQNIIHFAQAVNSGLFAKYDFGSSKLNHLHYGSSTPPSYDITKNRVPTTLYCGDNDWLADLQDIEEKILPELHDYKYHVCKNFDHLDFIWGLDAAKVVYTPIMKDIQAQEPEMDLKIPQ